MRIPYGIHYTICRPPPHFFDTTRVIGYHGDAIPTIKPRINTEITAPQVRVIGERGENLGVMAREQALALRRPEEGIDCIEIAAQATPPVVRLMSFDKYRYELEKAAKKDRLAQKGTGLKQVQISARAGKNDLLIKLRKLEEFLNEGHQVEIQLRLRGREKGNKDWARQKLHEFLGMITVEYKLFADPKFGGRGMIVQLIKK